MNIILLSGGSGKRLWPLSNDIRSKQFIRFFPTADGGRESMLERMYRGIRAAAPDARITVATSRTQASAIRNQLGDGVALSLEPARRDTFPAMVLATAYLHDVLGVGRDEQVVFCPVDPYVEEDYFRALVRLEREAAGGRANLTLLGMEPTEPSEKYGYILPADRNEVSEVLSFREKPDRQTAQGYLDRGALWNGGVFALRIGYLLDKAEQVFGYADHATLYRNYSELTKISFDYAVAEKEAAIRVLRFSGVWRDLGTWSSLTDAMAQNHIGDVTMGDCRNVHAVNELNIPILTVGLSDAVVVAGPDGILVADKEKADAIKPYVDSFDRQVMFAEKSWGSYRVLDEAAGSLTIKVTLRPGHRMNYHSHKMRDEIWVVSRGSGRVILDGETRQIRAGDLLSMPAGCRHTVIAESELTILETQLGEHIDVHDKEKFPFPEEGE